MTGSYFFLLSSTSLETFKTSLAVQVVTEVVYSWGSLEVRQGSMTRTLAQAKKLLKILHIRDKQRPDVMYNDVDERCIFRKQKIFSVIPELYSYILKLDM